MCTPRQHTHNNKLHKSHTTRKTDLGDEKLGEVRGGEQALPPLVALVELHHQRLPLEQPHEHAELIEGQLAAAVAREEELVHHVWFRSSVRRFGRSVVWAGQANVSIFGRARVLCVLFFSAR